MYIKKMNPCTDYGHYLIQFVQDLACCEYSFIVDFGIATDNTMTGAFTLTVFLYHRMQKLEV